MTDESLMVPGCLLISIDHMSKRYDGTKVRRDNGRWDEGMKGQRDKGTKGRVNL